MPGACGAGVRRARRRRAVLHAELLALSGPGRRAWRTHARGAPAGRLFAARHGGAEEGPALAVRRAAYLCHDAKRAERSWLLNPCPRNALTRAAGCRGPRRGVRGLRRRTRAAACAEASARPGGPDVLEGL